MMDNQKQQFQTFNTNLGTLFLGNNKEVLKILPTASIDAVITDPPWGVGYDEYDDFNHFLNIRNELYRVMKDNSWLLLYLYTKRIYDLLPYYESAYTLVVVLAKGKPKLQTKRRDVIFVDELPFVEGKIK